MRKLISGLILAFVLFLSFATPAFANCDGWAADGSEHRNSGNGCTYTCRGSSWSGPNRCDGKGNGVCQGCGNASAERQAAAVAQSQREATAKVQEQGAAATAAIAQQTAGQRAREANVQQAMVEEQRQRALSQAQTDAERAAINQRAQAALTSVSEAAGVPLSSVTAQGGGGTGQPAIPQGQSCDPNSGVAGSVGVGGGCCRGGVSECNSETNGICHTSVDRVGTSGSCGAKGTVDPALRGTTTTGTPPPQADISGQSCHSSASRCVNGVVYNCVSRVSVVQDGTWQPSNQSCRSNTCTPNAVTCTSATSLSVCTSDGSREISANCREGWQCRNNRCGDVALDPNPREVGEFCDPNSGSEGSASPGQSCCVGGVNECTSGRCDGSMEHVGRCVGGEAAERTAIATREQAIGSSTCGGIGEIACGAGPNGGNICDDPNATPRTEHYGAQICRQRATTVTTTEQAANAPDCGGSSPQPLCGSGTNKFCDPGFEPNDAGTSCQRPVAEVENSAQASNTSGCGSIGEPACGTEDHPVCDDVPGITQLNGQCFVTNTAIVNSGFADTNPYCGGTWPNGEAQNPCGRNSNICDNGLELVSGKCRRPIGSEVNSDTEAATTPNCGGSGEPACNQHHCDLNTLDPNQDGVCAPRIADPGQTSVNNVTTYPSYTYCDAIEGTRACHYGRPGQWACVNENEFPPDSDSSNGCERWVQNLRTESASVGQSLMNIRQGETCPSTQGERRGATACRCTLSNGYTRIITSGTCEPAPEQTSAQGQSAESAMGIVSTDGECLSSSCQCSETLTVQRGGFCPNRANNATNLPNASGVCVDAPCQCPDGSRVNVDGGVCADAVTAVVLQDCAAEGQPRENSNLNRCCHPLIPVTERSGNGTQTICQNPNQVSNITQNFEEGPVLCGDSQGCNCINTGGVQYATVGFGVSCPIPDDTGSMAQHPLCTGATVRHGTRMSTPCQIPPIEEFSESTGIAGQCQTGFRASSDGTRCDPLNFVRAAQSFLCSVNPNLPECGANPNGQYLSNRGVCPEGATCVCVGGRMNGNTCETFQTLGIREVCGRDDVSLCRCPSGEMGNISGEDVCLPRENGNFCSVFQAGSRCIDGYRFECRLSNAFTGTLVTNAEECEERQCPSGQFRCNSETQAAFCREDGSEWISVNCSPGFVCNANTNNRCADRRPLTFEGNKCNLLSAREYATHLDIPQCGASNYICQYGPAVPIVTNGQPRWVCPDPTGQFDHGCPEGQLYDEQSAVCNQYGMPACVAGRRVTRGTTYSQPCHDGSNDDSYGNCRSGTEVSGGRCVQPVNVIPTEAPIVEEATPVESPPPTGGSVVWGITNVGNNDLINDGTCVSCDYTEWATSQSYGEGENQSLCHGDFFSSEDECRAAIGNR